MLPEGTKAQRVYLSIRDDIKNGLYEAGSRLPSETKLMHEFDVSRVTIRRALEALITAEVIERESGIGHFVSQSVNQPRPIALDFNTLLPQVVAMGQSTNVRLLSFCYESANSKVASMLGLTEGSMVQAATRIRLNTDTPFSHLTTYVPESIARNYDESDLAANPLYRLLEKSGVRIASAHQTITASLASPEIADALCIDVGSAIIALERVVRDDSGNGVEFLRARYRPDLFTIDMTLNRVHADGDLYWEPRARSSM